jgi:hypothetical protein
MFNGATDMCKTMTLFSVVTSFVVYLTMELSDSKGAEKSTPVTTKTYSSPQEVFDVYRDARNKWDFLTMLSCATVEWQETAVFDAYSGCLEHMENPKVIKLLKDYGADDKTIEPEFFKRYKEKHGIDIEKMFSDRKKAAENATEARKKEQQSNPSSRDNSTTLKQTPTEEYLPPLPPFDQDLMQKVVYSAISDKAGFCKAVEDIISHGEPPEPLGKLEHLKVEGNTAEGRAKTTLYHIEGGPRKEDKKVRQEVDVVIGFHKSNGGWLIESVN